MLIKGKPYELKKKQEIVFAQIAQVDAFNASFKNALLELMAKEKALADYDTIWKLQE